MKMILKATAAIAAMTIATGAMAQLGPVVPAGPTWSSASTTTAMAGAAQNSVSGTWAITANVVKDCSAYSNGQALAFNLGNLGITADDAVVASTAFNLTGTSSASNTSSTVGCNTENRITVAKNDLRGLVNANPGSYDTDNFQANLPYSATVNIVKATLSGTTGPGTAQSVDAGVNADQASKDFGAFRSQASLTVKVPAPSKAPVAGAYAGNVTFTIAAL